MKKSYVMVCILVITGSLLLLTGMNCTKPAGKKTDADKTLNGPFTWNNVNNPHEELAVIENVIRSHIGWAVNNKDQKTLYSTIVENDELFFIQPDSKSTVRGIDDFRPVVNDFFMREDFKAIRVEITDLRIHMSPSQQTAWYACILNDFNEFQGRPANWENVRWTGVLEKVNGQWKIFQMHYSKAEDLVK
ncbi:MAG TPA: nuclear transport factor 2 family protein [bacterium]|nr:nuclear transport factor 2 family protein [bacterium]HPN43989.1 nuclear transport factor 2 family protein [bacterium]